MLVFKRYRRISISVFCATIIILTGTFLYVSLCGTPWEKAQAQEEVLQYIKTNYNWTSPNIVSPTAWDSKLDEYEVGVTFPGHVDETYFFAEKDGVTHWSVTLPANEAADQKFNTAEQPPLNATK